MLDSMTFGKRQLVITAVRNNSYLKTAQRNMKWQNTILSVKGHLVKELKSSLDRRRLGLLKSISEANHYQEQ